MVQLLTLDEYNSIAARMLNKRMGRSHCTYDNIGLVTHYLIRADLAYGANKLSVKPGYEGRTTKLSTFRWSWFNKIKMRMICGGKNKKTAHKVIAIDDIFEKSEYGKRRDTFCAERYISETEYLSKFKEMEELIDAHFRKPVGKKQKAKPWNMWTAVKASNNRSPRTNCAAHIYMKHFYVDGMSCKAIAEKYEISTGAVWQRIQVHSKRIDWDLLK